MNDFDKEKARTFVRPQDDLLVQSLCDKHGVQLIWGGVPDCTRRLEALVEENETRYSVVYLVGEIQRINAVILEFNNVRGELIGMNT